MRICIVIQNEPFRASAGMRIRYDRFADCLADGSTIEALTCEELAARAALDHDAYLFCKTFTIQSLLLARRAALAGKAIGQDLIDDYFSQSDDARLSRYRDWMRQMAPVTDFVVCTTPRLREIAAGFMPDTPITVIDDPVSGYDPLMIGARASAKADRAARSRIIEAVWFGIGDNPYFAVGISDLAAFGDELARIERLGWRVRLKIVTNARPFARTGLAALRALDVEHEVIDWSEEQERAALLDATVALLPVNGQAFSRAKSLNRAVTAINAGCQVLNLGFPLYERLDRFVYRSAEQLVHDLAGGTVRLDRAAVPVLTETFSALADPFDAATAFIDAARRGAERRSGRTAPMPCVIHGRDGADVSQALAVGLGGLSVKTPYCGAAFAFPVRFDLADRTVVMRVTLAIADRFDLPAIGGRERTRKMHGARYVEVDLAAFGIEPLRIFQPLPLAPFEDVALHGDVMRYAARSCRVVFGAVDIVFHDESPISLPFPAPGLAA